MEVSTEKTEIIEGERVLEIRKGVDRLEKLILNAYEIANQLVQDHDLMVRIAKDQHDLDLEKFDQKMEKKYEESKKKITKAVE